MSLLTVLAVTTVALLPSTSSSAAPSDPGNAAATGPLTSEQALARAIQTGKSVPADAATTATDTLMANPNGSLTLTRSVVPVRKRIESSWVTLDATLHANADGTVSPEVTTENLTLSGGGTSPLAVLHADAGKSLALTAPMSLPKPVLSGPTATYAEVLPGVDIQIIADTQGGIREVFIVHDAVSAANPALSTLTLGVKPTGVTLSNDTAGNITAADTKGRAVFTAPAPQMWDSTPTTGATVTDPRTKAAIDVRSGLPATSSPTGPGAAAHVGSVRATAGSTKITLAADAALLTASTTRYPVYIDPSMGGQTGVGYASVNYNNAASNYWNKTGDPTSDNLQVGDSGSWWAHTLINVKFDAATLAHATISSAVLNMTNVYSYSCTATDTNVYAPTTTLTKANATWNAWFGSSPIALGSVIDHPNFAHGYSTSCPASGVGFNVTAAIQAAAGANRSTQTFVLTGGNETSDVNSWKKFSLASVNLSITYNQNPNVPVDMSTSPVTSCTASTPTIVGDGPVTLQATVSDPDGGNVGAGFTIWKTSDATKTPVASTSMTDIAYSSSSVARLVVPETVLKAAANGSPQTGFSWQIQVGDGSAHSSLSSICSFIFDTSRTGAPTITPPASSTMGVAATVTIAKAPTGATPASYLYQLNGGTPISVAADASGNASVTVTPRRFTNLLTVTSLSAGGNIGDQANLPFTAAKPTTQEADQDLSGDNFADLITTGGQNGVPAGLWYNQTIAGTTQLGAGAVNIGINGNGSIRDLRPDDFTGGQVITGHFTSTTLQDVLVYYPNGYPGSGNNKGGAVVLAGNGDGSPLLTQYAENATPVSPDLLADNNEAAPLSLVNAGNLFGFGGAPDLLSVTYDSNYGNGYYLDAYKGLSTGSWDVPVQLTQTTPAGDMNWQNWTLTACQTAAGTSLFLWNKTTGALYLWTSLAIASDGVSLTHTQYALATSGWQTGATLSLQAADINGDGNADLWAVGANQTATAYLVTGSANRVASAQPSQTIGTATHTWTFSDSAAVAGTAVSTVQDRTGTGPNALDITGTAGSTWNTGDLYTPDVSLDGTNGVLSTTTPAAATNADFSLTIRVKPAALGGTVLSENGTNSPAIKLWSDTSDSSWRFAMSTSDAASPTWDTAQAPPGSAAVNMWTELTITYTKSTGLMTLALNGARAAGATHTTTWNAAGGLHIGNSRTSSTTYGNDFAGQVSLTQTFGQAVTATSWYAQVGAWSFDTMARYCGGCAPGGGTTSVSDSSGNNHTVTAYNVSYTSGRIVGGPYVGHFNNPSYNSYATTTTSGLINTSKSYTYSAWVKLNDAAPWATIVSETGVHVAGGVLQHMAGGAWAFGVISSDANEASIVRATSTATAVTGVWTQLTGVYDASAGQVRLYVNGVLNGTANATVNWTATGNIQIGREWWDTAFTSAFPGSIADVRVFAAALDPTTIAGLAAPTEVGHWPTSQASGSTALDTTMYGHAATLQGNTIWGTGHTAGSQALHFDGTNSYAKTSGPVLDTTQSFTVAAWVKLNPTGQWASALVQEGTNTTPFDLQYDPTVNKWAFTVMGPDSISPTQTRIWSTSTAQSNTWTHLAASYDATSHQIRLYVNGTLNSTASATISWTSAGNLVIGRDWWVTTATSWWNGDIQDIHAYQGALNGAQIAALSN